MSQFSAGPQALGYLYQARVALFLLIQASDDASVQIEALDDIQLESPSAKQKLELSQLKHHVSKTASLTDASPEFWKTVRVWSTHAKDRAFLLDDVRLYLITTAEAGAGTIAAALRSINRDTAFAQARMDEVSEISKNKELKSAFDAYRALSDEQRTALVSRVTVLDGHADILDYAEKTRRYIRSGVRAQFVDALYERLEGWWFGRVVKALANGGAEAAISASELHDKAALLAQEFHEENLPIDFEEGEPETAFMESLSERLFVSQLSAVGLKPRAVTKAILDYYRAFQQRGKWLEDGLLLPDEVARYENRLIDEWERVFDAITSDLADGCGEAELVACGRRILFWAEQEATNLRIRPRVEAEYVRRGSFHMLADREPTPAVHWHPRFVERLQATLTQAAAGSASPSE